MPTKLYLLALLNIQWWPTQPTSREKKKCFHFNSISWHILGRWKSSRLHWQPPLKYQKKEKQKGNVLQRSAKIIWKSIANFHKWNYATFSRFSCPFFVLYCVRRLTAQSHIMQYGFEFRLGGCYFAWKCWKIKICSLFLCSDIAWGIIKICIFFYILCIHLFIFISFNFFFSFELTTIVWNGYFFCQENRTFAFLLFFFVMAIAVISDFKSILDISIHLMISWEA